MRSVTIIIPGRPPTPNARPANHFAARNESNRWKADAAMIARAALPSGWVPLERALVNILFCLPTRQRRDMDNLIASTKPLTDGLVEAGVLVDDSIFVIRGMTFDWVITPRLASTQYRVEEA